MKSPVFLLCSGRSGSTLLQRALNVHPEVVMFGEHQGFLGPIADAYHSLKDHKDVRDYIYGSRALDPAMLFGELSDYKKDISWVNNFTENDVDENFKKLVLNLLANGVDLENVHWGFKEIRYNVNHKVVWFLINLFENAKFLTLVRSPLDTISSVFFAWNRGHLGQEIKVDSEEFVSIIKKRIEWWTNIYLYLERSSRDYPKRFFSVQYEHLIQNYESNMKEILAHVDPGLAYNPNVANVFSTQIASTSKSVGRTMVLAAIREILKSSGNQDFHDLCVKYGYDL